MKLQFKRLMNDCVFQLKKLKERCYFLSNKILNRIYFFRNAARQSSTFPETNSVSHAILWMTLFIIITFFIWSKFAVIQESITTTATVISITHVQTIQNREGGIIKKIFVHEGDVTEKNAMLLKLDPTGVLASIRETQATIAALSIKIARLSAEIENKPLVIPEALQKQLPNLANDAQELYHLHSIQMTQLQKARDVLQQELSLTKPLIKAGAASEVEVLRLQRQIAELENQIAGVYSRNLDQLESTKAEYSSLSTSLNDLQDRLERTTILSPIRGIVKQINISTENSVVSPGAEIMSIVPLEETLLVEANVKPSDVGSIHKGTKALIRISAYESSIYGDLRGIVDSISTHPVTDSKGQSYYLVRINIPKNYLRNVHNQLFIVPGMKATVTLFIGKRSVLDYLISSR